MTEWIHNIDVVVGGNWNTNLAKTYIAAQLHGYDRAVKTLQKDLDFERAVNDKVRKVIENSIAHSMKNALNKVTLSSED